MTPLRLVLWGLLAVAQLGAPAWMIVGHERLLREGRQLKLQTRPVDPADVFRGGFVALGFPIEEVSSDLIRGELKPRDTAYLELREGAGGFAEAVALHREKPDGDLVIKVKANYVSPPTVHIELPFDRFYMDEHAAPAAEAAYRDRASDEMQTWVTVRVLGGRAVLEELYLGGKPVREFLRAEAP